MLVPRISRFTPLSSFIQLGSKPETRNPKQKTKNKEQRTKNKEQKTLHHCITVSQTIYLRPKLTPANPSSKLAYLCRAIEN